MTPSAAILSRYRAVQVTTCTPGQLLVMLYEGLLRILKEAEAAIVAHDPAKAGERTSRAHAILEQLLGGLDHDVAPQLCDTLAPLYVFCMRRIVEANLHQDSERVAEIVRVLCPLRDAWITVVEQQSASSAATGPVVK